MLVPQIWVKKETSGLLQLGFLIETQVIAETIPEIPKVTETVNEEPQEDETLITAAAVGDAHKVTKDETGDKARLNEKRLADA